VGIIARFVNHTIEKLVTITAETVKAFNINTHLYTPAGDDSVPLKDERLLLIKVGGTGKHVCTGVLTMSQGAKPGEKILYSRNKDGEIVSKISMLGDGTIIQANSKDHGTETKGDRTAEIGGNKTENVQGNCTVTIKGNVKYSSEGGFSIKGKTMEITGDTELVLKTIGATMWCPNGLTNCLFSGAPHGGSAMGITGLKGG